MSEKEHRDEVIANTKHKKKVGGCLVRCSPHFARNNQHSYRGQARIQAEGESRIDYKYKNYKYKQNAHHVIPVSVLWHTIETVSDWAKPRPGTMRGLVIDGLLTEKYNINLKNNMIVLATQSKVANHLGLPLHLKDKAWNHPDYSAQVEMLMASNVDPQYEPLSAAVKEKKHVKKEETPNVKDAIEEISVATYEAIIAVGMASSKSGNSQGNLDTMADAIIGTLGK